MNTDGHGFHFDAKISKPCRGGRIFNRRPTPVESGERFAHPDHPYSADLDLFGKDSLFQTLSTARTRAHHPGATFFSATLPKKANARFDKHLKSLKPVVAAKSAKAKAKGLKSRK